MPASTMGGQEGSSATLPQAAAGVAGAAVPALATGATGGSALPSRSSSPSASSTAISVLPKSLRRGALGPCRPLDRHQFEKGQAVIGKMKQMLELPVPHRGILREVRSGGAHGGHIVEWRDEVPWNRTEWNAM